MSKVPKIPYTKIFCVDGERGLGVKRYFRGKIAIELLFLIFESFEVFLNFWLTFRSFEISEHISCRGGGDGWTLHEKFSCWEFLKLLTWSLRFGLKNANWMEQIQIERKLNKLLWGVVQLRVALYRVRPRCKNLPSDWRSLVAWWLVAVTRGSADSITIYIARILQHHLSASPSLVRISGRYSTVAASLRTAIIRDVWSPIPAVPSDFVVIIFLPIICTSRGVGTAG